MRTLEKGAHLRRNPRGFPRCALSKSLRTFEQVAHLPTRAPPWTRCRWSVKSHRIGLRPWLLGFAFEARAVPSWVDFIHTFLTGALRADSERHGCREKKSRALIQARLRIGEIYSLSLYRYFILSSQIMRTEPLLGQYGSFLPAREESATDCGATDWGTQSKIANPKLPASRLLGRLDVELALREENRGGDRTEQADGQ